MRFLTPLLLVAFTVTGCAALRSPFPMFCTIATDHAVRAAADRWIAALPPGPTRMKAETLKPLADISADAACTALKALEQQYDRRQALGLPE